MKLTVIVAFSSFVLFPCAHAQSDVATFKADVPGAFVWGVDTPTGAKSWSVKDPLTGIEILEMSHDDVELSSQMGFEKLRPDDAVELIAFTTTIVNNSQTRLSVEAGDVTVDGHLAPLLSVDSSRRGQKKSDSKKRANFAESSNLYCFTSGFLSSENILSKIDPSSQLVVAPRRSLTVSGVIRDPRHYSMLCSKDGCFPKGSARYAVRVGGHEYVFTWPGRSMVNCGR